MKQSLLCLFSCLSIFLSAYEHDLAITHFDSPSFAHREDAVVFEVTFTNIGSEAITDFQIVLFQDPFIVEDVSISGTLYPNEMRTFPLVWMVEDFIPTEAYFYVQINQIQDENLDNNTSSTRYLRIFDENVCEQYIVSYQHDTTWYPFNFSFENNLSETIYYDDELNFEGNIVGISYLYNFQQSIQNQHLRIFVGNTYADDLENSWISAGNLTKVFDDAYSFLMAAHSATFMFDPIFGYAGNNLVILTNRVYSNQTFSGENSFYEIINSTHVNRTRAIKGSDVYEPYSPPNAGFVFSRMPSIIFHFEEEDLSSVNGAITTSDNESIYGVNVVLDDKDTYSNSSGNFLISRIQNGNYTIVFEKTGFETYQEMITLNDETLTLNVTLDELEHVSLSGRILFADHTNEPVIDEIVYLSGYDHLATITDGTGSFYFPTVFKDQNYTISVTIDGYLPYQQSIVIGQSDLVLEDIFLQEELYPCENVTAESNETETFATITWDFNENRDWQHFTLHRLLDSHQEYPQYWELVEAELLDTSFVDTTWNTVEMGNYRYALQAVYSNDMISESAFSNVISKTNVGNSDDSIAMNKNLFFSPNPFNPQLEISYTLPDKQHDGLLTIFNVKGQMIKQYNLKSRSGKIIWDAHNQAAGIYFVSLKQDILLKTKKAILLK